MTKVLLFCTIFCIKIGFVTGISAQNIPLIENSANIFDKDYLFTIDMSAKERQLTLRRTSHFEKETKGLKIVFQSNVVFEKLKSDTWRVKIFFAEYSAENEYWKVNEKEFFEANFIFSQKKISYKITGNELNKRKIDNVSQEGWDVFETEAFTEEEAISSATDYFFANYGKVAQGARLYSGALLSQSFEYKGTKFSYTIAEDQSKKEFRMLNIYRHDGVNEEDISQKKMVFTTSIEVKDSRKKNKQIIVVLHHAERPNNYAWRTLLSDKISVMYDFSKEKVFYKMEGEKIKKDLAKLTFVSGEQLLVFDNETFFADDAVGSSVNYFIMRFYDLFVK